MAGTEHTSVGGGRLMGGALFYPWCPSPTGLVNPLTRKEWELIESHWWMAEELHVVSVAQWQFVLLKKPLNRTGVTVSRNPTATWIVLLEHIRELCSVTCAVVLGWMNILNYSLHPIDEETLFHRIEEIKQQEEKISSPSRREFFIQLW